MTRAVHEALAPRRTHGVDEIAARAGVSLAQTRGALGLLELDGAAVRIGELWRRGPVLPDEVGRAGCVERGLVVTAVTRGRGGPPRPRRHRWSTGGQRVAVCGGWVTPAVAPARRRPILSPGQGEIHHS
ncbi:DprA-like winged helix domain-containing protein [Cellulomonas soli]